MNKEQQIKDIKKCIGKGFSDLICGAENFEVIYECIQDGAVALYNAGYRKTFTSDLASDTQKAYKDGYEKGIKDEEEKRNRLLDTLYGSWDENSRLKNEIIKKDEILQKNIDTAIDTHKRYICNIDEQRKQAVKEFAEKLQKELPCRDYTFNGITFSMILTSSMKYVIDKLLKEYEK